MSEDSLWSGKPSQSVNSSYFFVCLLGCFLIVPMFLLLRRYLMTASTHYSVDKRFVHVRNDRFGSENRVLELWRVKDIRRENEEHYTEGMCDLVFVPTDEYTKPLRYQGVFISQEEADALMKSIQEINETRRISEIQIPVLG